MLTRSLGRALAATATMGLLAAALVTPAAAATVATTWVAQTSNTTAGLDGVSFVDCNNGWAAGDSSLVDPANSQGPSHATIVHTSDGGATWARQDTPIDGHIDRIVMLDKMHGWAAGTYFPDNAAGFVLWTSDGGTAWNRDVAIERLFPNQIDGLWATDMSHVFVGDTRDANSGSRILQTSDGGGSTLTGTWSVAFTSDATTPLDLEGLHAVDSSHVWAIGESNMVRLQGGTWSEMSNGVAPWAPVTLSSVFFFDAMHGWAVGHQNEALYTSDGGTTWTIQRSGTETDPNNLDVRFYDLEHGFFAGDNGRIFATSDHGQTWTAETTPSPSNQFEGMSAPNSAKAWAVGSNGSIVFRKGVPFVSGISPASGPNAGGTQVVVTGCGFTGATGVSFGTRAATTFTVNSDTQITVDSPPYSGGQQVTVTNSMGTSAVSAATLFTYIAPTATPSPTPTPALPKAGFTGAPSQPGNAPYVVLALLILPVAARLALRRRRRRH